MIKKLKSLIGNRSPIRLGWHYTKAFLAACRYGFPARKMKVIGITGTDGKTTTVGMLTEILDRNGKNVCTASTAFFQIRGERTENASHLTSIDARELQKFLRKALNVGCDTAVIEVSSHALVQGRVHHTYPCAAGITNIALEHLDYHGSMEQYMHDKGKLFRMLRGKGTKVLNRADESYPLYEKVPSGRTLTYGTEKSSYWVSEIEATEKHSKAVVHTANGESLSLTLNVPGAYNLSNALCAIALASTQGVPLENSIAALAHFTGTPGRMECIDEGQPFSVFVDFAVSPQSYEKTLEALRAMVSPENRVLVLCGSCGNRMKEKRPIVGNVCSKLADVVIATEDETYGEDPHAVLEEVWNGIDQSSCEAHKIFDRREAIALLFSKAAPGDAVVLCGMGPFSTFTKLEGRIPWDEREIAREELRRLQ